MFLVQPIKKFTYKKGNLFVKKLLNLPGVPIIICSSNKVPLGTKTFKKIIT